MLARSLCEVTLYRAIYRVEIESQVTMFLEQSGACFCMPSTEFLLFHIRNNILFYAKRKRTLCKLRSTCLESK